MAKRHRSEFLNAVKEAFPELHPALNREYGLLHLEMHVFTDFVQSLIDTGDRDRLILAFQLADTFLREGNGQLQTALAVSFLEHLNFTDDATCRSWAEPCLTSFLRAQYRAMGEWLEHPPSGTKSRR